MSDKRTKTVKTKRNAVKPAKKPQTKTASSPRSAKKKTLAKGGSIFDGAELFDRISAILEQARARVARAANTEMVLAYWRIGREIVEHLQDGDVRADYGKKLIDDLSARLGARFGRGYSTTNLRYVRTFFMAYRTRTPEIRHFNGGESHTGGNSTSPGGNDEIRHLGSGVLRDLNLAVDGESLKGFSPVLGWTHYRALMKVEHEAARSSLPMAGHTISPTMSHESVSRVGVRHRRLLFPACLQHAGHFVTGYLWLKPQAIIHRRFAAGATYG